MKRSIIRLTLILGIIAIFGIITVQIYLIRTSHRIEEKQLNQSIKLSLRNVAQILSNYHESTLPYDDVVYQYSSTYFIVNVNTNINAELLEHYLIKEFKARNLDLNFEYAIYDCYTDEMVYGNFICIKNCKDYLNKPRTELPKYDEYMYYFGVSFPDREKYVMSNMKIWYFFSGVLVLVILFFGYSQFIILRQKQLSEIQSDFIDNMTHEFKTPISSIYLSSDVLLEKEITTEPERIKKYAKIIKSQALFLQQHVEKVLHLSGNTLQTKSLNKEKIYLNRVLEETIENLEPEVRKMGGTLSYNSNCANVSIMADKLHFVSVVTNILENALKYRKNAPMVDVQVLCSNKKATISVKDNGPGIPQQEIKKVFRKFYRIPHGNVHNTKGFGLGLSYVKKIARMHRWNIKIESTINRGTTFTIVLKTLKHKHG